MRTASVTVALFLDFSRNDARFEIAVNPYVAFWARKRHADAVAACRLLGAKRTWRRRAVTSPFDPQQTYGESRAAIWQIE